VDVNKSSIFTFFGGFSAKKIRTANLAISYGLGPIQRRKPFSRLKM